MSPSRKVLIAGTTGQDLSYVDELPLVHSHRGATHLHLQDGDLSDS